MVLALSRTRGSLGLVRLQSFRIAVLRVSLSLCALVGLCMIENARCNRCVFNERRNIQEYIDVSRKISRTRVLRSFVSFLEYNGLKGTLEMTRGYYCLGVVSG